MQCFLFTFTHIILNLKTMNKFISASNSRLFILYILIFFPLFQLNAQNTLSKKEINQGWKLLFNGTNFDGWRSVNQQSFPEKGWIVKDKTITCTEEKGGSIITVEKYGNFELQWEWRFFEPGANSGLKYFVVERIGDTGGYGYGIEYQMLDDLNLSLIHI